MRKLTGLIAITLLAGCTSKEVQLAELQLEAEKVRAQERKELRDADLIKEVNKPKELLVLKGCGAGCEATLYNPFHETKLPTNEWDYKSNRDRMIKETITGVVTPIVAGKVLKTNTRVLGDVAIAAVQGAGHNTTTNSTVTEDNDVTETTTITEDNDTSSTTTTTTTTTTETQTETHENSHNVDDNSNNSTTTTTTTEIKEEKDESEENNT